MNTLEINKIVGAVLVALLVVTGIRILGNALIHPEPLEKTVYLAGAAEEAPAEAAAEKEKKPEVAPVAVRLQDADLDNGKSVANACRACHTFDKGGGARVGPNLYGVVGSDIARREGFAYSDALAGKDGAWTYARLDDFLMNPSKFAAGTKMMFAGVGDPQDRADLIAYLRTLADKPEPLPAAPARMAEAEKEKKPAEEKKPAAEAEKPAGEPSFAALVKDADVDAGKKVARKCTTCHTLEKGGGARVGPNLYGIVGDDKARREGFGYSDALKNAEGKWTYEDLNAFVRNPNEAIPGNRMPFAGIKDEQDRANLIAYLRTLDDDPPPLP